MSISLEMDKNLAVGKEMKIFSFTKSFFFLIFAHD